ncbi:MAG: flagellar brake protein [Thermodesulfobacteriota bacterium]
MKDKSVPRDDNPPHLPITLGYELLIEIPDLEARIKSQVAGLEHGKYIIVKIPTNDLIGVFNREEVTKSPVTVMYRYKGCVYRFGTTIQKVVNFPDRLLFLKYPREVVEHCVPEKIRHKCNLPCQTMLGNDIVEMAIVDISQNGCLCVIKTEWEDDQGLYELIRVDTKIDIMAQFPGSEKRYDLTGIVRNVSKDVDNIHLGVIFGQMPPDVKDRVADYIASI